MFGEYKSNGGRELLKEMAANKDETIMTLYEVIEKNYPYLLEREYLQRAEINQYNNLVNSNVEYLRVKEALRER